MEVLTTVPDWSLIIDDDEKQRSAFAGMLSDCGFETQVAAWAWQSETRRDVGDYPEVIAEPDRRTARPGYGNFRSMGGSPWCGSDPLLRATRILIGSLSI
jgi:hypothetical protein